MRIQLPELGVGLVYSPGLAPLLLEADKLIDFIEIEPQLFWLKSQVSTPPYRLNDKAVEHIAQYRKPKTVHGIGFPVGGTAPIDLDHIAPLLESIRVLSSPWVSEHLSFNRVRDTDGDFATGFLLPPVQTPESVAVAVHNIRNLASHLPVPFAFETGVNYLQPVSGEMSDGAYFRAVAEQADCGILLDLHNVWTNERNGRQAVHDLVGELPLDRIWEIHLGGGQVFQDYWVDAHSDLTPIPVMDLAQSVIPFLPNLKALVFEIMPESISARGLSHSELLEQIRQMQQLWASRRRLAGWRRDGQTNRSEDESSRLGASTLPAAAQWESALGRMVVGLPVRQPVAVQLANDKGVEIFRNLAASVRAGNAVATLKLTSRLLMLSLGDLAFRTLLEEFWRQVPPEMFASSEAMNLGSFLKSRMLDVPHLYEVLDFEISSIEALVDGSSRKVRFTCDPTPLLTALDEGLLPATVTSGDFELVIEPG